MGIPRINNPGFSLITSSYEGGALGKLLSISSTEEGKAGRTSSGSAGRFTLAARFLVSSFWGEGL